MHARRIIPERSNSNFYLVLTVERCSVFQFSRLFRFAFIIGGELEHLGARLRIAERVAIGAAFLSAGPVVLAKSDRFRFWHHCTIQKDQAVLLPQESTARS